MTAGRIVDTYLDILDAQREAALATLAGLTDSQIWQRPAPKEWCIGEILNHNYLLIASTLPLVRLAWRLEHWAAVRRRAGPYRTEIADLYRTGRFPMWVGFLWTPRHTPGRPVPLDTLAAELRGLHRHVRAFYAGKDEAVLGHTYLFDPLFGCLNLIVTLRLGMYHDQLHYEDIIRRAVGYRNTSAPQHVLGYTSRSRETLEAGRKQLRETGGIRHDEFWRDVEANEP
jgi:hypothetical protein